MTHCFYFYKKTRYASFLFDMMRSPPLIYSSVVVFQINQGYHLLPNYSATTQQLLNSYSKGTRKLHISNHFCFILTVFNQHKPLVTSNKSIIFMTLICFISCGHLTDN